MNHRLRHAPGRRARGAGADLPALFCNNDELANALIAAGEEVTDPMWRMPLFSRPIAACSTARWPTSTMSRPAPSAASITAALYLKEFVPNDVPWAHFDMDGLEQQQPVGPARGRRSPGRPRDLPQRSRTKFGAVGARLFSTGGTEGAEWRDSPLRQKPSFVDKGLPLRRTTRGSGRDDGACFSTP